MTYLFGERWLSNCLLYQICLILNAKFLVTKTWVYYSSDIEDQTNVVVITGKQICKQLQLILIVPVGYNGGTYFMGSLQVTNACESKRIVHSNNFALAIYSLEFNIVADAATHGWGMPKNADKKLNTYGKCKYFGLST